MADIVARFKGETSDLDNKVKRASKVLLDMAENAKRTGAALSLADKEEVAFVASLGKLETSAKSTKGKLREMTQSIADLTSHYRELSATDKNSEYGKALKKSIEELTQRAGNLRDVMDDTAAAIGNVATDTQFANGMNMMTNAVGQCASAVVAWTGGGKEMEQVIKDLAKIQTTIAAVKALTEAFQKQNMVLLKNPYVLAATAVAALGVAMYELAKKSREASEEEKAAAEAAKRFNSSMEGVSGTIGNAVGKFKTLQTQWELVKGTGQETEWLKTNQSAFSQMGLSIKSVNDANKTFITNAPKVIEALKSIAKAQALQEEYGKAAADLAKAEAEYNRKPALSLRGTTISENDRQKYESITGEPLKDLTPLDSPTGRGYRVGQEAAKQIAEGMKRQALKEKQELVDIYGSMYEDAEKAAMGAKKDAGIAGYSTAGGGGRSGKSGSATDKPEKIQVDVTQSLTDLQILEDQLATVKNSMKGYGESTDEWKEMNAEVESLTRQIDILNGKAQGVQGISFGFSSSGTGDYIQMMQSELANADFGTTIYQNIQANLQDASALTAIIQELANNGVNDAELTSACETLWNKILGTDGDAINSADWSALEEQINAKLAELNIEPIKLDIKTGNVEKTTKQAMTLSDKWSTAANMIQTAGNALNNFESPAAKIGGIIAQTVATLAAAYAQNLASDQTTKGNIWAFIAAAAAATVSLGVTVAAVKKNAEYHAQGGIVGMGSTPFIPRGTDTIPAMLTPGEVVLSHAQTANLASNLQELSSVNGTSVAMGPTRVQGRDLLLAINNELRATGRRTL